MKINKIRKMIPKLTMMKMMHLVRTTKMTHLMKSNLMKRLRLKRYYAMMNKSFDNHHQYLRHRFKAHLQSIINVTENAIERRRETLTKEHPTS